MARFATIRMQVRSINQADIPIIQKYAADKELSKKTLNIPYPYPEDGAKQFYEATIKGESEGTVRLFVLEENQKFIGQIALSMNQADNSAELGYWIARPFWGAGFGTEAAEFITEFAFEQLHLKKLFAAAQADNIGSRRILEKVGMRLISTTEKDRFRFGQWSDTAHYELTDQDFENKNQRNN